MTESVQLVASSRSFSGRTTFRTDLGMNAAGWDKAWWS
jgi:hypothetical protein